MLEVISQLQGFRPDVSEKWVVTYFISNGTDMLTVRFKVKDGNDPFSIGDEFVEPARNALLNEALKRAWDLRKLEELKHPIEMDNVKFRTVDFFAQGKEVDNGKKDAHDGEKEGRREVHAEHDAQGKDDAVPETREKEGVA
jgi:hypothetical protein